MKNFRNILSSLRFINPYLLPLTKPKNINMSKVLIIAGSPRSGTTWLGDLISNIPKSIVLFEPLHLDKYPRAKEYEFEWRTYINSNSDNPKAKEFFEDLFNCRFVNSWITREVPVSNLFDIQYFIFKFVRANMLIDWLNNNFYIKKPVFIIRHPCAVVSSQLRLKQFSKVGNAIMSNNYYEDFPLNKDKIKKYKKSEEILAARWCQENYVPLINNNSSILLVTYENLLNNPEEEIKKIFNKWKIEIPKHIYNMFSISSSTTHRDIDHNDKFSILSRWQNELEKTQKINILNVVKDFGMDFYTEELEPDYERLNGDSPIKI